MHDVEMYRRRSPVRCTAMKPRVRRRWCRRICATPVTPVGRRLTAPGPRRHRRRPPWTARRRRARSRTGASPSDGVSDRCRRRAPPPPPPTRTARPARPSSVQLRSPLCSPPRTSAGRHQSDAVYRFRCSFRSKLNRNSQN